MRKWEKKALMLLIVAYAILCFLIGHNWLMDQLFQSGRFFRGEF